MERKRLSKTNYMLSGDNNIIMTLFKHRRLEIFKAELNIPLVLEVIKNLKPFDWTM